MLRRSLLIAPVVAALAALVGVALAARPLLAAVLAATGAVIVAVIGARVADRRVAAAADRILGFAGGDTATRVELDGSPQWRRLANALSALGGSLEERFGELAEERARVERLLETLPTAILLFSADRMAFANPAARRLFGIRRSEMRTPLQVLGVKGLADAVAEAGETNRSVSVDVRRDERELAASAAVTAQGEVALVVSDLTEARRLEAVRRDFVANASHELKTPVAAIQALADALVVAIERDPTRARRMIDGLQHEASRLAQLVRDLLDLSLLEDTDASAGRQRVDVAEVVRTECERLAPVAEERGVALRANGTDGVSVVAVPGDVRLIVGNLLENAVRYNRRGGDVDVVLRREGSRVVIEVSDTGIGIPEADQDRVFERFYRVDKGRSRDAGGTGLGLSIVRHAAERHGGQVTVRSVLGEGSLFRVVLPVEGADQGAR